MLKKKILDHVIRKTLFLAMLIGISLIVFGGIIAVGVAVVAISSLTSHPIAWTPESISQIEALKSASTMAMTGALLLVLTVIIRTTLPRHPAKS